jgi:hypothetical protein
MSEKEEDVVDEDVKYYLFITGNRRQRHFAPQYLSAGMTTVKWIFPVPKPNTIGTLDKYNNGIVFIKFGDSGTKSECNVIAQNFSKIVFGGFNYRFSPNFSEDTIVYSKTRIAVITNVKTGKAFHAKCGLSKGDYILGIRFLDPQKNLFVIVKSIRGSKPDKEIYLHIMKLEEQQLIDTGWNIHIGKTRYTSWHIPLYYTWFVYDGMLFVYDNGKILCTDGSQPVSHPFSNIFNNNSDHIGNIKDLAIHPKLPFGVMIEDHVSGSISHQLTVVCWKAKKKKAQIAAFNDIFTPLASLFGLERIAFAYQSFSPDGNWYVAGCLSPVAAAATAKPKDPFFIAIPVSHEHSNFLVVEELIVLGQVKNMTSLAWTTNPTSYVISNGERLHKWDLDELPAARVLVVPGDSGDAGGRGKRERKSIFRKIRGLFRR